MGNSISWKSFLPNIYFFIFFFKLKKKTIVDRPPFKLSSYTALNQSEHTTVKECEEIHEGPKQRTEREVALTLRTEEAGLDDGKESSDSCPFKLNFVLHDVHCNVYCKNPSSSGFWAKGPLSCQKTNIFVPKPQGWAEVIGATPRCLDEQVNGLIEYLGCKVFCMDKLISFMKHLC